MPAAAQQLSFAQHRPLSPQAQSDKGVALLHIDGNYSLAWKAPGSTGVLHIASWSRDSSKALQEITLPDALTIVQPALTGTEKGRYLIWQDTGRSIRYKYCAEAGQWDTASVRSLEIAAGAADDGLMAVYASGRIVLVNRASGAARQWMAVCTIADDGLLHIASYRELKIKRSAAATFIAPAAEGTVRFCRSNGQQVLYRDYQVTADKFGPELSLGYGNGIASVAGLFDTGRTIAIWRSKSDQQWYYQATTMAGTGAVAAIPGFLNIQLPVALCAPDPETALVAYTGNDQRVYLAKGNSYDPASWMSTILFPEKEHYTLKDIVLPGAHDAGMSILNGVGGKSTYTINDCNTLTQQLPVARQLRAGIRMFDLRIDRYDGALYTKHAPSDCMDDAVGGGYGERLDTLLYAVKHFLNEHPKEIVLLSFCHFCERYISIPNQAKVIAGMLGKDKIFYPGARKLEEIPLKELAGKVIVSFEGYSFPAQGVVSNTMNDGSDAFFNYRRRYAATNRKDTLVDAQQKFFLDLKSSTKANDMIRVDWQLSQIGQEAALSCSQFQSEDANLLLDGALLLVNAIKGNKSIISRALMGNRYLAAQLSTWIDDGVIDRDNKPNILYVDVAGSWITDICVSLNSSRLYRK